MGDDIGLAYRNWESLTFRLCKFHSWKEQDHILQEPENHKDLVPVLWEHIHKIYSQCNIPMPSLPEEQSSSSANEFIATASRNFLKYKDDKEQQKQSRRRIIVLLSCIVIILFLLTVYSYRLLFDVVIVIVVWFIWRQHRLIIQPKPIKVYLEEKGEPEYIVRYMKTPTFQFVHNVNECDVILSAKFPWGNPSFWPHQAYLQEYANAGKKVAVFWVSDTCNTYRVPKNVFFFRTSMYRSARMPTEDILGYVFGPIDPKKFYILPTTPKPIVGFCGGVWDSRKGIIELLKKDKRFTTNFLERPYFAFRDKEGYDDNILQSHFTICNRGAGNFSMRFYDTLSVGRVPVLIDTDLVFPFYNEIPWDTICVKADNDQELADKIHAFYERHNMERVQQLCFDIYQKYFQPENYFSKVFHQIVQTKPI